METGLYVRGADFPVLERAGWVGSELRDRLRVALLSRPTLAIADVEPLVAAQPVNNRSIAVVERRAICLVGNFDAGNIGNVLAESQRPVDSKAWHGLKRVVFLNQFLGFCPILFVIFGAPPI